MKKYIYIIIITSLSFTSSMGKGFIKNIIIPGWGFEEKQQSKKHFLREIIIWGTIFSANKSSDMIQDSYSSYAIDYAAANIANNDLKYSNSDIIKSNIKINNFITSFEYLEEDNVIGNKSYITNTTKYDIDKNKSMSFEISKNLDKNITDYYNLIYEYKNDCMTAALEYNKTFYDADDLESDQNIFFTIKIIPFGKLSSPSIN